LKIQNRAEVGKEREDGMAYVAMCKWQQALHVHLGLERLEDHGDAACDVVGRRVGWVKEGRLEGVEI
jgi:hypothetical protein